ncbi:MAG: hypothetical protein VX449_08340, partial [Pseudomonadota bacterium]|nr:hypothetical protein [Pseudomonadota bacterium]
WDFYGDNQAIPSGNRLGSRNQEGNNLGIPFLSVARRQRKLREGRMSTNYFLYVAAELICLLTNLVLRSRAGMPFSAKVVSPLGLKKIF